ncbi:MAG: hypothetical protein COB84_05210 [Rhodobacteraceae bacterium]|nr:MAG: hypothetical protein COB84_05210 [Paracoccaceae bacterium]
MKLNVFFTCLLILPAHYAIADPLSAVDWLSDSLQQPQQVAPADDPLDGISTETIETTILSDVVKDTVGLLPAQVSGIPTDFWGDSAVKRLAAFIRYAPHGQVPEITNLWRRIILAELNAPVASSADNLLLLARIDNLLLAGDLNPAESLLKAADPNDQQLFRRWFDISILTQRSDEACARMIATPRFAPTLPARIFCLARSGDWSAAAITLSAARILGDVTKDEALLLGMFLDPEAFPEVSDIPSPIVMTPLTFIMREALGLPRPSQTLPLAFLHLDLQNKAGWKRRIIAAERLVREQALPTTSLLDIYLEGKPSASGGVWQRVSAVQRLKNALERDNQAALSAALINAHKTFEHERLRPVLAQWFGASLPNFTYDTAAQKIAFDLAALAQANPEKLKKIAPSTQTSQYILSLLDTETDVVPVGDLQLSIFNGLHGKTDKTVLHQLVDDRRVGEAVLSALTLLQSGADTDVGDIETALSVLAYAGFKDEALRIAVQILILGDKT